MRASIASGPSGPPGPTSSLRLEGPTLAMVAAGVTAPPAAVEDVARALRAHALAAAESFSDLLCLGALLGVETLPYQVETVRRVLKSLRGRALLADEVGLGKTVEAIMTLREYQLRSMVRRALILVPPALVGQWVGELASKAGIEARHTNDRQLRLDPDQLWRGDGVVVASLALARGPRHAPAVQAESWDMVIVDEAHRAKSRGSASFRLVDGLKSRFLLLLTATPIEKDLEELYQIVTLLRPGQFASPAAFRSEFVDRADPTSPRNRDRLRALLGEVMIRNTRAQSGLKLPPRYVSTVLVEPAVPERTLYAETLALYRAHAADGRARLAAATLLLEAGSSPRAVAASVARMLGGAHEGPFGEALRALAVTAGAAATTRKTATLLEIIAGHRDKVLVFSRYRATLDELEESLAARGLTSALLHGGLDAEKKRASLVAFAADTQVLLSTDVGAEGLNLQFCHLLVNFDLPWNPMLIEQRIGRLHRFGQTREVQVYNLCGRGTVEERILEVLSDRLHLFELVVGEMDMVLGDLADERDLEERILSIYERSGSAPEVDAAWGTLAAELIAARGRYDRVKTLDEALFGEDYAL
jgi:SNF2 family DNA or RNA helicase